MADIELVIKIPEGVMEYIKNNDCLAVAYIDEVAKAIKNGTPLPEHHGRLIDADVVADGFEDNYELCIAVNDTPTIIPATKEEKQTLFDRMEEEFGKDWDVPKQTATKEGD